MTRSWPMLNAALGSLVVALAVLVGCGEPAPPASGGGGRVKARGQRKPLFLDAWSNSFVKRPLRRGDSSVSRSN